MAGTAAGRASKDQRGGASIDTPHTIKRRKVSGDVRDGLLVMNRAHGLSGYLAWVRRTALWSGARHRAVRRGVR